LAGYNKTTSSTLVAVEEYLSMSYTFRVGATHAVERALSGGSIYKPGGASQPQPALQFVVRDTLSLFGFGGQNAGGGLLVDFLLGSLCETASEFLMIN
jgi:hypothetical protein